MKTDYIVQVTRIRYTELTILDKPVSLAVMHPQTTFQYQLRGILLSLSLSRAKKSRLLTGHTEDITHYVKYHPLQFTTKRQKNNNESH